MLLIEVVCFQEKESEFKFTVLFHVPVVLQKPNQPCPVLEYPLLPLPLSTSHA